MKTNLKAVVFILAALATTLTGCLVVSVYPFYNDKDTVAEPGLLGNWSKVGTPSEKWVFAAQTGTAYRLTETTEHKTYVVTAQPFRLKGQLFLDVVSPKVSGDDLPPHVPTHMVMRVPQLAPTLRLVPLDYEWLDKLLEREPDTLRHHAVLTGGASDDKFTVLTANTAELQLFLLRHLDTTNAWEDPIELKREPATPVASSEAKPAAKP